MASPPPDRYLGAGVLIVDPRNSSLLLIHDYTQDYNCCGGRIKYNDDDLQRLEKTASEEMSEETRTLVSCPFAELALHPFVDIVHKTGRIVDLFRCYIYKIECPADICEQFDKFDQSKLPFDDDFYEVTNLALFPIKQFRTKKSWAKIDANSVAKNSKGDEKQLNRRVIAVIEEALRQKLL